MRFVDHADAPFYFNPANGHADVGNIIESGNDELKNYKYGVYLSGQSIQNVFDHMGFGDGNNGYTIGAFYFGSGAMDNLVISGFDGDQGFGTLNGPAAASTTLIGGAQKSYFPKGIGIGSIHPDAQIEFAPGTTAASSQPIRFESGSLQPAARLMPPVE
jgi:hypothetical protein